MYFQQLIVFIVVTGYCPYVVALFFRWNDVSLLNKRRYLFEI